MIHSIRLKWQELRTRASIEHYGYDRILFEDSDTIEFNARVLNRVTEE